MKKHLLFLFTALLPLVASAQTKVEFKEVWYNLDAETNEAEVTYKGDTYYESKYSGSITIPATITCEDVEYRVTSIGEGAFYQCRSLTAITFAENSQLTTIGEDAFYECEGLTTIAIPESATSIREGAFSGCINLASITFAENSQLTTIEANALSGCHSLKSIAIPTGVASIEEGVFYNCESLMNIILPEGMMSIGEGAFGLCYNLESIALPKSVTSIGAYAFTECTKLATITLPDGVTSIGEFTFGACSSLSTIVLPKGIESIGNIAFASCPELTEVYCHAETTPTTEADAFEGSNIGNVTLYVPEIAIESYKNTEPWSNFGAIKSLYYEECAIPTIAYINGKVSLTCETEGAKVVTTARNDNEVTFETLDFNFAPTFTFIAYATKAGYGDSAPTTLTICWIPCYKEHEEGETTENLTIPSNPVIIQCTDGMITLTGLAEDEEVAVSTIAGTPIAATTATNGTATLATGLTSGTTAIVKIGGYSVKVAIK